MQAGVSGEPTQIYETDEKANHPKHGILGEMPEEASPLKDSPAGVAVGMLREGGDQQKARQLHGSTGWSLEMSELVGGLQEDQELLLLQENLRGRRLT